MMMKETMSNDIRSHASAKDASILTATVRLPFAFQHTSMWVSFSIPQDIHSGLSFQFHLY